MGLLGRPPAEPGPRRAVSSSAWGQQGRPLCARLPRGAGGAQGLEPQSARPSADSRPRPVSAASPTAPWQLCFRGPVPTGRVSCILGGPDRWTDGVRWPLEKAPPARCARPAALPGTSLRLRLRCTEKGRVPRGDGEGPMEASEGAGPTHWMPGAALGLSLRAVSTCPAGGVGSPQARGDLVGQLLTRFPSHLSAPHHCLPRALTGVLWAGWGHRGRGRGLVLSTC